MQLSPDAILKATRLERYQMHLVKLPPLFIRGNRIIRSTPALWEKVKVLATLRSTMKAVSLAIVIIVLVLYTPRSANAQANIFAVVAPTARTTTANNSITAFATIVNAGTSAATSCSISLPAGLPAGFRYQTTDPGTNMPIGTPNSPIDIPAAQSQTFYFAITPTSTFSEEIPLVFGCTNTSLAPSVPGLTTLLVTAGDIETGDLLSIAATPTNDGNIVIAGTTGSGLIGAAAINIAKEETVTFKATDTPFGQAARHLPLDLTICQTDASGACINPTTPGPSSTLTVAHDQIVYFSVFATGHGIWIPYDPANSRIFILATLASSPAKNDASVIGTNATIPIGAASAAVKMCASDVNDLQQLNQNNLSASYCIANNLVTNVAAATDVTWQVVSGGQIITSSNNPSSGATIGNPAFSPRTGAPIAKDIVADFGARCDGVSDDAPAFGAFNAWAVANQANLQVQLTIPSGSICELISSEGIYWAKGIKDLLVLGYGATISDGGSGGGFTLAGLAVFHDDQHSARLATVSAGSATVTLLAPSQSSRFKAGSWALITGYDLQGYGYPPNPHFFEYVQISAVNAANGQITFGAPLKNTYESTWPLYWSGNALESDQGGPATLYALDPSWDTQVEYRGLTITRPNVQMWANGRSITFKDVSLANDQYCIIPSQTMIWRAINSSMTSCSIEVDKLVGTIQLDGTTIGTLSFQSSSTDLLIISNSTVTGALDGTPKKTVISDSTINTLKPGAYAYGRSDELDCTNCVIHNFLVGGVMDKGGLSDLGVNNAYTMSAGVISVPVGVPVPWAVPGTNLMWAGVYESQTSFRVLDVTRDANNTYVRTTLSGGFPAVPMVSGKLYIHVHPAPRFSCTNCVNGSGIPIFVGHPAGAPLFSYWTGTLTGNTLGTQSQLSYTGNVWGKLSSLKINVTKPYTGALSTLLLHAPSAFDNYPALNPDGTVLFYRPIVDLKSIGQRTVDVSGVMGAQSTDTGLSLPSAVWFTQGAGMGASANVTAEPQSVWPTVTIEIITDQGVVTP